MNLNLSDWDWLSVLCGILFLYRGVQDLRNGGGTGWSSEDEKKHFGKPTGIALLVCIGFLISHLCYTLSRDDKDKKK